MRVVARDVIDHLEAADFLSVDRASFRSMLSAVRSIDRFMTRIGYSLGQKNGLRCYILRDENALERDVYLVKMTVQLANEKGNLSGKRIVYVGESYLFQKYTHDE